VSKRHGSPGQLRDAFAATLEDPDGYVAEFNPRGSTGGLMLALTIEES